MADRVAVIITTLVTIEAYRTKSTYRASAFIEIGKDSPAVRSAASGVVIQADDDMYYPQLSINTNLFVSKASRFSRMWSPI